ncbi:MAG: ATP-binding cassette domain-containing protein [Rhodospirillales bacterium]|nr:ATP-binding cassette domain-containing protein [Rhodospirillales bacterium]MDE0711128.1 ATP-binding cassette domain-containing protein [Rhodospirillales bacterium]
MLSLERVNVHVEAMHVLRDVTFGVEPGSTVALIGRNGAGKTTTLRSVMGLIAKSSGTISFAGTDMDDVPPHRRPALGIGYAPEDRRLFSSFNVEENILLPARVARADGAEMIENLERVYETVPELKELRHRPAGSVSGGQGKMVALGRALMIGTRLVLLDEPFQGLAPALARRYGDALRRLRERERELSLVITESNPALLAGLADATFLIERGEVAPAESVPDHAG